ncbi:MAG: NAD(+) diphosphatase [Xanthobacteraceae bacterium]|nr:NAD(+) diphosphatase [Xanthobacteraceae bacterium]
MITNPLFPVGSPGFATHPIDRAAHLRDDVEKLMALEERADARAYVVHRDQLLIKTESTPTAALSLKEARGFGANPGTVFLGLRDGRPLFGMGIPAQAVEALMGRPDVRVNDLRGAVTQGLLPVEELSAIAMAKSLVSWHQRHGFCANCGQKSAMSSGGWRRDCPACKTQHFPRTDPVVIMLVTDGERCLLGRQAQFPPGMWSCLAGFVEIAETIEDAVRREVAEEAGVACTDVAYYRAQPWPYPSSLMIGCTARATTTDIVVDKTELEDARWFSRDEAAAMLRREHPDGLLGPHPVAIAYHLVAQWLNGA